LDGGGGVGFVLGFFPFGIGIARRWFTGEFEPAFGRAIDVGMKKRWRDFHKGKLLHS